MKSRKDPRHKKRQEVIKQLFAYSFSDQKVGETAQRILKQVAILDKKISDSAPAWPINKLNRIDLAILRLAAYEIKNTQTPPKVIIDEAVELAKEFGSENSPSFINGVLGDLLTKHEKSNSKN